MSNMCGENMAAPMGNKNAVGHGRPANPGFSDEEVIALGEELLKWCQEQDNNEKSDVVHLSEWYSEIKRIAPSQFEAMKLRSCFVGYYEKAMKWMGKRILKNTKMPSAYGSRFLGIYFKEVKEHEMETVEHKIDYEIKKKKEADLSSSYPSDKINDAQIAWIKAQAAIEELQKKNKELEEKLLASQPKAD